MRYISSNFSFAFFDDSTASINFNPLSPREAWEWVKDDSVANIVRPDHELTADLATWATGNRPRRGRSIRLFGGDELLVMLPPQRNQRPDWDSCRFILVDVEDTGEWTEEDEG